MTVAGPSVLVDVEDRAADSRRELVEDPGSPQEALPLGTAGEFDCEVGVRVGGLHDEGSTVLEPDPLQARTGSAVVSFE